MFRKGSNVAKLLKFSFGSFLRGLVWVLVLAGAIVARADSTNATLAKFEAESGTLGTDWAVSNSTSPAYITITTGGAGSTPSSAARVATYSVSFPTPGTYELYARVRVGPGTFDDDSMFYGNGFGVKDPTLASGWIFVNGLADKGFTAATNVVTGGGTAGSGVWKWINLSQFAPGPIFTVAASNQTQTFQIGARENGLDLDAFAFGTTGYNFTVGNLDAGADGAPPTNSTCTVNWTNVFQRIDGFGASSAWRSTWNSTVADRYFSTNTGLGLSLLRTRIAPGGTTVESSIMRLARDRGARVWSAPWTPTTNFKTTNANGVFSLSGGSFVGNTANYQAYANQLAGYVVNMKNTYGVSLYALSVQNEPDFVTTNYESCGWSAQQIHDFVPYLSAALTASNVGATKILIPESESWGSGPGLYNTTMTDTNTAPLVGVIANHNYVSDNNNGDQSVPAALNSYGKALWETEVSTFNAYEPSMTNGIYWARRLHQFLTVAQVNAWHYWWFNAGDNSGIADSSDNLAKRGYVLGQFSRFVRPDFYRIGVITNFGTALVSAYRDTNSAKFAIVAINADPTYAINLTVNLSNLTTNTVSAVTPWITSASQSLVAQTAIVISNATFTYSLPANSIVTFAGQLITNTPPTFVSVGPQAVNPGVTVLVPNAVTDPDLPGQTLTFILLTAPTNATLTSLNASNALFTWRPLISQAASTNSIQVKVTDNGTPNLSATNNFVITVNAASQPVLSSIAIGSQVSLSATGMIGPDYTLLVSSNLVNWQALFTTNPATMPVTFTDTNRNAAARFYRLQLGP